MEWPSSPTSSQASNLVTNGSFEQTTNGGGQLGYNTDLTGWSVPTPCCTYTFVFASGTADTTGENGQYGNLQLWGPNNGSANGLPATSPDGGNFVAADGAYETLPLSQTINGLTAGDKYNVTFYWAGARSSILTTAPPPSNSRSAWAAKRRARRSSTTRATALRDG